LLLQFKELLVVYLSSLISAHALEDTNQVDAAAIGQFASSHWSAADEDGRDVDAHSGYEHTWDDFVAVGNTDHGVKAVRLDHCLDTIGN